MDYFKIGTIINTRGLRGELKVKSDTDFQMDRYKKGNIIYILYEGKYLDFTVLEHKNMKNQDFLVLKDHEDINLVERYKGCEIFVSDDSDTTLYEDEYHISEIIGLEIYQKNNKVGEVWDVKELPQGDYLDIVNEEGKHSLVPFRDEFIVEIDLEEGYIEIIEMEGLL